MNMIDFYWPITLGECLAYISAISTIGFGFLFLFTPRLSFRIIHIQTHADYPEAIVAGRSTMAGFYLGVGICCFLFSQPMLWMALGLAWGFTAFGRLVSIIFDKGNTHHNWISVSIEIVLASFPLAYAFNIIA
jgi:cytochrome c biogenesis protein CcdA